MHLQYFTEKEFREWYDRMSPRLLTMLDILRYQLGLVIEISGSDMALGREQDPAKESEHNINHWGEVLAVDCFVGKNTTQLDAIKIISTAKAIGFTGIGVYPFWTNNQGVKQCGFHFGVRPTRKMGDPATWGYFEGEFITMKNALHELAYYGEKSDGSVSQ
jgi:hypothetical protein